MVYVTEIWYRMTLLQGAAAAGSISASLTSATYAALQSSSGGGGSSSGGGSDGSCGSSIGALLDRVREFPDMMPDDEREARLER